MAKNTPKVIYLEEALMFIESLPQSVGDKLLNIVHRIEGGERNAVLFSKLEGTEIWEFRTLFNKVKYRLFAFWDTQTDTINCHARHHQENAENTKERDCQGRENQTRVF